MPDSTALHKSRIGMSQGAQPPGKEVRECRSPSSEPAPRSRRVRERGGVAFKGLCSKAHGRTQCRRCAEVVAPTMTREVCKVGTSEALSASLPPTTPYGTYRGIVRYVGHAELSHAAWHVVALQCPSTTPAHRLSSLVLSCSYVVHTYPHLPSSSTSTLQSRRAKTHSYPLNRRPLPPNLQ
jgi:hypothetical protein